ncbi:GPI mannosyltransferase-like protein [Dinothrombium tinctorium]|uniref:GPI alpha-1,4-mannosyltransferase I, catalytic subunit n=1 Tax=Dinothrombium tinctorium TaxID=1965070 RepID=A0A3S3P6P1_9ACAR|nr:GPI mannosyltransferase-like protein [Dinothrombium tinctorium]
MSKANEKRQKSLVEQLANHLSLNEHLLIASLIRIALVFYGLLHDKIFEVKYTDVDYIVFTDGARYLSERRSPFLRHGYRYTPLLAYFLLPNIYCFYSFGKFLFAAFDVLTAVLIFKILSSDRIDVSRSVAKMCACLWLYNPLSLVISTRGSSESIITFLVLAVIYLLITKRYSFAGLLFGLVIHFKFYTVIYSLSLYFFLNCSKVRSRVALSFWLPLKIRKLQFVLATIASFVLFTYCSHLKFGKLYINEAWLYHFTRKDIQHNFSPYFYIYHIVKDAKKQQLISYLAFLPQAFSIIYYSLRYSLNALFCETFLFVTLNKVCTSQYFLWYLCLLPLIVPFIEIGQRSALKLMFIWLAAQLFWLLSAYFYQFRRIDSFLHVVWFFSIIFLFVNLTLLLKISANFKMKISKKEK